MNEPVAWIVLPAAAVLAVVAYIALWLWINYRPPPQQVQVEHAGADDGWADELGRIQTGEWPALMSHADYVTAGRRYELPAAEWPALEAAPPPQPAELDLVAYATGGEFTPVPYAVEGEVVEPDEPDVVWEPPRIFDSLLADHGPINLDWAPPWASSYTQYMRVLGPTYALPAGDRDLTGSFAVVGAS